MALYTLADLHLSLGTDKAMDVFGGPWAGYMDKLRENLSCLREEDTLVIPGDLSWGLDLNEALPDLRFLGSLPGRKLLVKGNHDLWWGTVAKMRRFFGENGITGVDFIHNTFHLYRNTALCGTRGWFFEEETGSAHDEKILNREAMRLKASLDAAKNEGAERIYCFMHYPPLFGSYECPRILELLSLYGVEKCFYGHLHGKSRAQAFEGTRDGVEYCLVSGDHLDFMPKKLQD